MVHLYGYLFFLFILIGFISCNGRKSNIEQASLETNSSIIAPNKTKVSIAKSEKKIFEYLIETKGKIFAEKQTELHFQITGVLKKVHKQNGNWIKEGEVIAELDKTALQIALDRVKEELLIKQGDYQLELDEYSLYNGDTSSLNDQQRLNMLASSGLGAARIQYREAKYQLANTLLRAPFSGVIANQFAQIGSLQSLSEAFCTIYAPQSLQIMVEVLEGDFGKIKIGQKAAVSVINNTYSAIVTQINPLINDNGMLSLLLTLQETKGLLPGMNANVTLHIPQQANVVVPKEAVVIRSGRTVVFTFESGLAKWHYVTIGNENGLEVEIIEGLNADQQVITNNNLQLSHDTPVEISFKSKVN